MDPAKPHTAAEDTQQALLQWDGKTERLTVSPGYFGPAARGVWLLPVPGRVRAEDITTPEPEVLARAFRETAPERRRAMAPSRGHASAFEGLGGWPAMLSLTRDVYYTVAAGVEGGAVDVETRVRRGRYDVAVLAARTGDGLEAWLKAEGFALPEGLGGVAGGYLARGWRFVAARVTPAHTGEAGGLPPLAVAFPAEAPVFPLAISRVSAPPRLLLHLVVESSRPVRCTSLTEIAATERGRQPLDQWRRRVCDALDGRALICEYAQPRQRAEQGAATPARTRYWARLDRAHLADLTFAPRRAADTVEVDETYVSPPPEPCWPRWAWGLVVMLAAAALWLWRASELPFLTAGLWVTVGLLSLGLLGVLAYQPLETWRDALARSAVTLVPSLGQRAEFLAADTFLLILSGLLLASMHRRPANAACRRLPWLVPVAIVSGFVGLVAEEGHVPDAWDWQLQRFLETSAAMLCLAHFSPGLFRAAFRALTGGWAMAMILVAIGCWAGRLLPPPPDERDYALRRGELLAAIGAFRRDTRALPTRLADLTTRVAPTTGCDAAGNPAALAGGWHGPYLRRLPIDPVTRRRDTWRYEPTGDLLVDAAWPTDYEPGPKYSVW